MEPEPDTKDWTWTLSRRCPECGLSAGEVDPAAIPERAFVAAEEWVAILRSSPAVRERPQPDVWSPLEYGAHVRDVYRLFDARLVQMLTEDEPTFANWDQDETAISAGYAEADPEEVADELEAAAQTFVARLPCTRTEPALAPRSSIGRGRVHGGELRPVLPARRRAPPVGRHRSAGRDDVAAARNLAARRTARCSRVAGLTRCYRSAAAAGARGRSGSALRGRRARPANRRGRAASARALTGAARCRRSGTRAGRPRRASRRTC